MTWPPCFIVKSHRSLKIISPPPLTPRVSPVHYKILPHPPHKDSRTKILITDEAELRQISNHRSRSSFNFNGTFFFLLFLRIRVHTNRSLYFFLERYCFYILLLSIKRTLYLSSFLDTEKKVTVTVLLRHFRKFHFISYFLFYFIPILVVSYLAELFLLDLYFNNSCSFRNSVICSFSIKVNK